MYLSNNFATNHSTIIFLSLIFLSGCGGGGGGGSSAPEVTQVITNSQTPTYWNLDAAFSYIGISNWSNYVVQNPDFMRPAEVPHLKGNPAKANSVLGWKPNTTFTELINMMMEADIERYSK